MKLELGFVACFVVMLHLLGSSRAQSDIQREVETGQYPTTTTAPLGVVETDFTSTVNSVTYTVSNTDVEPTERVTEQRTGSHVDSAERDTPRSPIFERLREPLQPEEYNYDFLRNM